MANAQAETLARSEDRRVEHHTDAGRGRRRFRYRRGANQLTEVPRLAGQLEDERAEPAAQVRRLELQSKDVTGSWGRPEAASGWMTDRASAGPEMAVLAPAWDAKALATFAEMLGVMACPGYAEVQLTWHARWG